MPSDSHRGLDIVRLATAGILIVHPIHGLLHPGDIIGFGGFLSESGLPFGIGLAWLIICFQIASCIALMIRRVVVPACMVHMGILCAGIWLIHRPSGWFVVGAGRNGMEYSVTLLACLFGVLWSHLPRE